MMKSLVKLYNKPGLSIMEKALPRVSENDVLIKVKYASICGTDVSIYRSVDCTNYKVKPNTILGHEFVGIVDQVGKKVNNVKIGDLVTAECHISCKNCTTCQNGMEHLCIHSSNIGIQQDGAFAEYVSIPGNNIIKLDQINHIIPQILSLLDPLGNAVHCLDGTVVKGKSIIITGAGPIGLILVSILKSLEVENITIIDYSEYRLRLAKELGANRVVNLQVEKYVPNNTFDGPELFDIAFEMSGSSKALKILSKNISPNAKIILFGLFSSKVMIDINSLIFKGVQIKCVYGRNKQAWKDSFILLQKGLNLEKIITHMYKLEDFENAFDRIISGKAAKVVFDLEGKHA